MIIISHRGNLEGRTELENSPAQIDEALNQFLPVEVDLRKYKGEIFLGHDEPQYKIDWDWLLDRPTLIVHVKTLDLIDDIASKDIEWFYHVNEPVTFTSRGLQWSMPGYFFKHGISVELGTYDPNIAQNVAGICTDYPLDWKMNID